MGRASGATIGARPDYDLDRLRGFSDCVFAVAITLVVSTFKSPVTAGNLDDTQLTDFLGSQGFRYVNYLAGFVLVGYFWLNHHRTFELVVRATGPLLGLNLVLLFFLVLAPFATQVLGDYHHFSAAYSLFNLNAALLALANAAIWFYVTGRSGLVDPRLRPEALRIYRWRSLLFAAVFVVALLAGRVALVLVPLAWLLLLAVHPVVRLVLGPVPATERAAEAEEVDEDVHAAVEADLSGTERTGLAAGARRLAAGPVAVIERMTQARGSMARLHGFSDNVYAFAITLLGLHLALPVQELPDAAALEAYLVGLLSPEFLAFCISFVVIGLFWALHCKFFGEIVRQDGGLRVLNLVHLMAVAVLPFATELLSTFSDDVLPFMVYAALAGTVATTLAVVFTYASVHHRLIDASVPWASQRPRVLLAWLTPAGFAASIAVAPWSLQLATVLWWAPFVLVRLLQRQDRRRHPGAGTGPPAQGPAGPPAPGEAPPVEHGGDTGEG